MRLLAPLPSLGALAAWLIEPISQSFKAHAWPWLEPSAWRLQEGLTPVGRFFEWLFTGLFGWFPDMSEWVSTTIRIAALVGVSYLASRSNLKRQKQKLEERLRGRSDSE